MHCKLLSTGLRCVNFPLLNSNPNLPNCIQESPTLDLVNECFYFVTGHFEVISASSPHIYHSALVLAPKESSVWKLYEAYAHPFIRVVWGALTFNTAAKTHSSKIGAAVCSPCNRFVAIALVDTRMVDILDSTTLQNLQTFESPQSIPTGHKQLAFSPDSCILSCSSRDKDKPFAIVSWDLQTGGIVSIIRHRVLDLDNLKESSLVYSGDGKLLVYSHCYVRGGGATSHDRIKAVRISIFDAAAGTHVYSHSLDSKIQFLKNIWIHGKALQFATGGWGKVTVQEVEPTPDALPSIVENFSSPHPDNVSKMLVQPLTTSYQFVCSSGQMFQVWDPQDSKYLLEYTCASRVEDISLSPDGQFLACSTDGSQIHLWKKSPTGYILHRKFPPVAGLSRLCFSQDGKSIVTWGNHTIRLWHTEGSITPSSTQPPKQNHNFVLDISLHRMVAAVAMFRDNVVTILDLEHSTPQLTIDAGMDVLGLRVIGNVVFVICMEGYIINVVTWDLPTRDCVQNSRASYKDNSGVVELPCDYVTVISASISPDSHLVGFIVSLLTEAHLCISDPSTDKYYRYGPAGGNTVQFSPDGCNVWCVEASGEATVRRVGDKSQKSAKQVVRVGIDDPPEGYLWVSPHGHQVTSDWWVLGPDGKRLLMLPTHWWSDPVDRRWKGQFLALLHGGPPEAVILDLYP